MNKIPNNKTKSAHHTVPKMYLKGFQDDNGHITLWERTTGILKRKATKYASTTQGYYTILDENKEETDAIENLYMKVENDTKPILERMTCVFPEIPSFYSHERMILSQYLAMQFTRTKASRRKSQLIYDHHFKMMVMLDLINKKTPLTEIQMKFLENPHQFGEFCQPQDLLSVQELELANKFEPLFRLRPWVVMVFNEPCLITSDTPIFLVENKRLEGFPGNGLATAAEFWFPLDSRHLLIMGEPICSYPFRQDRVICPNESPLLKQIMKYCVQSSNDAQIANCHMEAYGQKELLKKYDGKPLPKRAPFVIGGNTILDSYYNEAKMDLEPTMGHGKPASEIFSRHNQD